MREEQALSPALSKNLLQHLTPGIILELQSKTPYTEHVSNIDNALCPAGEVAMPTRNTFQSGRFLVSVVCKPTLEWDA